MLKTAVALNFLLSLLLPVAAQPAPNGTADVVFTFINRSISYSFLVRFTQTQVLLRALYTALGKVETKSWGLLPVGCLSLAQQTSGMSTLPTPGHQVQELGDLNLKVFEAYCPHAYSYAFDDNNSTFFCMNTNFMFKVNKIILSPQWPLHSVFENY